MVVLSLSRVSGLPHKMELSHPYRDLYITHLQNFITNERSLFGGKKKTSEPFMKDFNKKLFERLKHLLLNLGFNFIFGYIHLNKNKNEPNIKLIYLIVYQL